MSDVATIIARLGGQTQVGIICGFERNHGARGHDFKMRNCIPRRYWPRILAHALEKNIPGVTAAELEAAHSHIPHLINVSNSIAGHQASHSAAASNDQRRRA